MTILKITKWIAITILVVLIALLISLNIYHRWLNPYVPIDEFNGEEIDIGYFPSDVGITYGLSEERINGTKYVIELAGSRRDDKRGPKWDHYVIRVSKLSHYNEVEGRHPYFVRCFDAQSLPQEFWTNSVSGLYSFDSDSREIDFTIGSSNLTCKLPSADTK